MQGFTHPHECAGWEHKPERVLGRSLYRQSISCSINMDGRLFTRMLSLLWTTVSEMIGAGIWMVLLEEESEAELPQEGDNEEGIFILEKEAKRYLKEK